MNKIYLENLNSEQLMELVENNSDLRELLTDEFIECEMDYISDILNTLRLKDYDLGFYNRNYIKIHKNTEQLKNIKRATDEFGLLSDENIETVDYCIELINRLENMNIENKRYMDLETKIENLFGEIEELVLNSLNMMTSDSNINNDTLLDRLECILDWTENTYYIIENDENKYNVYRDRVEVLS